MTDLEARVLAGMQKRAALGLSPAKADYLAAMFGLEYRATLHALKMLQAQGLAGKSTMRSFTPEWFLTTAGHEKEVQ